MMNPEQVKGLVNLVVGACGGGGFIGGWINTNLTVEVIGALMVLGASGYQMWKLSRKNMTATVDKFPVVAGVILHPSPEGVAIANSIPSKTVAVSGTVDAAVVARS